MDFTPSPPPSRFPEWIFGEKAFSGPCFVLDIPRLKHNAAILEDVQDAAGARILLALKAFSSWPVFPLLSRAFSGPLWGTCASSAHEARLGREKFGGEVHAFAAAWTEGEIRELLEITDHLVFNSLNQWQKFKKICFEANASRRIQNPISFGLRLNPEASLDSPAIYNPCNPASRLGVRPIADLTLQDLQDFDGLHFHALCEQDAEDLQTVLRSLRQNFGYFLVGRQWLNFGGGHHITRPGYNLGLLKTLLKSWQKQYNCRIYLEPGEAVALNAGWLTATVLDIVHADMPVAILDISAACHMPDVLEMPYTPPLWQQTPEGIKKAVAFNKSVASENVVIRVAGKSCLAGDIIGEYEFFRKPQVGDKLIFGDMAIYSMVKTNTFNGLQLPGIGVFDYSENGVDFRLVKEFGYEDFVSRLG